ncbi:MAG TPA: ribonuclease HI family protein [Firmicutes bacterium]|uniref:Ribonuclease HI family protein n=1 Tax=Candidatus Fermentithermobacillus carboniphilus TaxID=3085328 RepID=A0AAT9LEK8_9FIRM|nr:MAG: ribonuclease HI family protein [Candidatus Fermentithermobacillus carboniphilus]HHW18592.1 ribonuclease HI family protein [Candidatus Fermentithermobacillaceae bacterium]
MKGVVFFDGASRGNPGPASCSAVVRVEGLPEREVAAFLGTTTNNVAEYCGLLLGLYEARELGADEVAIFSDSNLCVQQLKGEYKVQSPNLIPLYQKVLSLLKKFSRWEISHVPREENKRADSLSNRILDLQEKIRGE